MLPAASIFTNVLLLAAVYFPGALDVGGRSFSLLDDARGRMQLALKFLTLEIEYTSALGTYIHSPLHACAQPQ